MIPKGLLRAARSFPTGMREVRDEVNANAAECSTVTPSGSLCSPAPPLGRREVSGGRRNPIYRGAAHSLLVSNS